VTVGEERSWERVFSEDDVREFARLSGDQGRQHRERDEKGRLMAHGLLTLSLATKLGGDMNFVIREAHVEFLRPVWVGDRIRCTVRFEVVEPAADRTRLECAIVCVNQHEKEVLRGRAIGFVPVT
jgi:acyl dehydratase